MKDQFSFSKGVNSTLDNLSNYVKTDTIIGNPITAGEVILVPIITAIFGCGTGGGKNKAQDGSTSAGIGIGVAAGLSPSAMVVIKNDEVSLLPLKVGISLIDIAAKIPEIVQMVKTKLNN